MGAALDEEKILMDLRFFADLSAHGGYSDFRLIPGDRYACVYRFLFTHAILVGRMYDRATYENRWCYETYAKAKAALDAWDGNGEPEGWHRHPTSGRRRNEDGGEYINV